MRTVVRTQEGVLELNYMWMPTWIGMNSIIKSALEKALSEKIIGMTMDEDSLNKIDDMVIDFLTEYNSHVQGLREFLKGLKFVHFKAPDGQDQG